LLLLFLLLFYDAVLQLLPLMSLQQTSAAAVVVTGFVEGVAVIDVVTGDAFVSVLLHLCDTQNLFFFPLMFFGLHPIGAHETHDLFTTFLINSIKKFTIK